MIKRRKEQQQRKMNSQSIQDLRSQDQVLQPKHELNLILVLPFILHLAFMTFTAFFVMHVQVSFHHLAMSQCQLQLNLSFTNI